MNFLRNAARYQETDLMMQQTGEVLSTLAAEPTLTEPLGLDLQPERLKALLDEAFVPDVDGHGNIILPRNSRSYHTNGIPIVSVAPGETLRMPAYGAGATQKQVQNFCGQLKVLWANSSNLDALNYAENFMHRRLETQPINNITLNPESAHQIDAFSVHRTANLTRLPHVPRTPDVRNCRLRGRPVVAQLLDEYPHFRRTHLDYEALLHLGVVGVYGLAKAAQIIDKPLVTPDAVRDNQLNEQLMAATVQVIFAQTLATNPDDRYYHHSGLQV